MTNLPSDSDMMGQLKDLVDNLNSSEQPFLRHLPQLLYPKGTLHISASHALQFAKLSLQHDKPPVVSDALSILNQLVHPIDGTFIHPSSNMFYDNRTFFWGALGNRKETIDVIMHIFNTVIFTLSLG